jgi:hypothetical protein
MLIKNQKGFQESFKSVQRTAVPLSGSALTGITMLAVSFTVALGGCR